jgi:hypothetical protein
LSGGALARWRWNRPRLRAPLGASAMGGGGGTRQPIVVKVVLNEREMGEAVAEIVDGRVLDSSPRS